MCSATATDRILDVACARIAADGVAGTSVRAVAGEAGVSPALVIHHFGSKEGLVAACDQRVRAAVDTALRSFSEGESLDQAAGAMVALISNTPYLDYITRSLRDGGELGEGLFDMLYEISLLADRDMQAAGRARPPADPALRALLLLSLDLGMLMLGSHVERVLGASLDSPEIARRWVEAELELLTEPMLVRPDTTNEEDA